MDSQPQNPEFRINPKKNSPMGQYIFCLPLYDSNFQCFKINLQSVELRIYEIVIISLTISLNICFGCPEERSHPDGSFEYPQHMCLVENKKYELVHDVLVLSHKYVSMNPQTSLQIHAVFP